jgi:multidrug efflux pump subunit AcrA (membrane-fusion protein)
MYAEIGLGTDPRQTVLVPADGVLHVARSDYVLVETKPGTWKVTEVKVGEQDGTRVEILDGLQGGERVIGSGAILLKPIVVRAVQS